MVLKWLFVRAQAKEIKDGRMDAELTILDESLNLGALSRQVDFIVDFAQEFRKGQQSYAYGVHLTNIHASCSGINTAFLATTHINTRSQLLCI